MNFKHLPTQCLFVLILIFLVPATCLLAQQGKKPIQTPNTSFNHLPGSAKASLGKKQHAGLNVPTLKTPVITSKTPEHRSCFTVESEKLIQEKFPQLNLKTQFEQRIATHIASSASLSGAETVYKIPTIVHVVNYGEPVGTGTNLSQEQVMSQFQTLNEDFRRLGNGYNEHPSGADILIEFVPALIDPAGKPLKEPGIDRILGYSAYYEYFNTEQELKPNTIWNPDQYFNIWVVNFGGSLSNTLGYAQFPTLSGLEGLPDDQFAETDGVVIGYQYFGRTGIVKEPFHLGRTTTHEVGHWLGLRHIWGDGDCSVDDFCADTPNANGPNHTCTFRDSCPEEGADMIENYMDYSDDACMSIFTMDQRARMRTVLEVSPRRNSLIACQQATPALIGVNTSEAHSWFEYTAEANEVLTISSIGTTTIDTKVSVYYACHSLPINTSLDAQGTTQSELTIGLEAGETIKILWQGDDSMEGFDWKLSSSTPKTGAACTYAATAVPGNNKLPSTTLNSYWYSFNPATNNQKITIDAGGKSFDVYSNTCENLKLLSSGNNARTVYDVGANTTLYIVFDCNGGNFNWSLTAENSRPAESCSDAVPAIEGTNAIPYTGPFEYWYTYTMPHDGTLGIKGSNELYSATIFDGCGGDQIAESSSESMQVQLRSGKTVVIRWRSDTGADDFEWQLNSSPFENGEVCSAAKAAVLGTNTTSGAPQWFTYTTSKKTNLRISSMGMTGVDTHLIIKRSCDGPIAYDNDTAPDYSAQSELTLFGVEAGETFLILWSEKWSFEGFDWIIEEIDPLPGDDCKNAKTAVVGTNTLDYRPGHSNFGNIFWTKFTVPASGKKITAFASKAVDVAVYTTENCEKYTWLTEDQGKVQVFNLVAGQEILIIWDGQGINTDITWELSVEDISAGDLCANPIHAVQGINTSDHTGIWYDYTMIRDGNLKFTAVGLTDVYVSFTAFAQCDGNALYTNAGEYTKLPPDGLLVGLKKGDRVFIYWTTGYPFTGVTWSLAEVHSTKGDFCDKPLPAQDGLNHAKYASQWYSYTAERAGNLKISSRAFTDQDTDLYIYDNCEGNELAHADDIIVEEEGIIYFQSEAIIPVEAGQSLMIQWAGTWSIYEFDWEISYDEPRKGDSCEDPLTAVEGVNNAFKPNPSWFTFTMPRTESLTISSFGYTDHNTTIEIYDACDGTLIAGDDFSDNSAQTYLRVEEVAAGTTLYIKCYNSAWYPSERYNFEWRLFVGDPDPGLFCNLPAQAVEGINTAPEYTSEFYWYTFTMPASDKKLVIERLSSEGPGTRVMGVLSGCDWNTATLYGRGEDRMEITGLVEGEQILIYWGDFMTGQRPENIWKLTIMDLTAGDVCSNATEALPGINALKGPPTWYTYTLPVAGDIRISSHGLTDGINTMVEVYDGCDGTLIAANDNPDDYSTFESEVLLEGMKAGTTILIRWSHAYLEQVPFNWQLTIENTDNHAPALDNSVFELPRNLHNGQLVGTLQADDPDGDVLLYRIDAGNDDDAFSIDPVSGSITIADASKLSSQNPARELHVAVTDRIDISAATVSIDIVTGIDNEIRTIVAAYPNPANDRLLLEIPDHITVHQSVVLDINGRVILPLNSATREINVADIKPGVYYLKVETSAGKRTLKIAIVR